MAKKPKKQPVHKDVLMVKDGNLTRLEGIYEIPPEEPALRATVDKRDKRRGLWMDIELAEDD